VTPAFKALPPPPPPPTRNTEAEPGLVTIKSSLPVKVCVLMLPTVVTVPPVATIYCTGGVKSFTKANGVNIKLDF
jgi:hypothetical protein